MKLQNSKPAETPDQCIARCANNLIKAVLAAGYSMHSTPGMSSLDINTYRHRPGEIEIENCLSGWKVWGKLAVKVTFKPEDVELQEDEPLPFTEDEPEEGRDGDA